MPTYTYEPTESIGICRLLVSDTDVFGSGSPNAIFADDEYQAFLTLYGDVRLAAAQALDTIAVNRILIEKKIKLLDLETDGPAMAKQLQSQAAELRRQVNEDSGGGSLDVIEEISQFDYIDRLQNEYMRSAG